MRTAPPRTPRPAAWRVTALRVLALALASGAALPAAAQEAPDLAGAEAAVLAYVEAARGQDWERVAALTDPLDLARMGDFAAMLREADPFTGAMLGIEDGAAPEAVLVAVMGSAFRANPLAAEAVSSASAVVVGTVPEGDSLAHVVVRTAVTMAGREVVAVDVTTVRWDGDRWVVGLSDELEAMIAGMEIALEDPEFFGDGASGEDIELDLGAPLPPEPVRDPKKRE